MWIFSMLISHVADWMISSGKFNHTFTRKIVNSIGQFGPAIALAAASYTGCTSWLTVTILTIGVGLNGGIYSGFKVNHLDISPRFAGILMSFTNCLANLAGLLAPITAGYIIVGPVSVRVDQWLEKRHQLFAYLPFPLSANSCQMEARLHDLGRCLHRLCHVLRDIRLGTTATVGQS